MTPTLKAVVEAMAAELVRQDGSDQGRANYSDVDDLHDATLDGHFDLEALARAGLAAIREPDKSMIAAFEATDDAQYAVDYDANVRKVFGAMIDAILKEAP